jgi:hypothetical protein
MKRLSAPWVVPMFIIVTLSFLLLLPWAASSQSLPAAGPGDYLIEPGEYTMTNDIVIDVNATGLVAGNCSLASVGPCVVIHLDGFAFFFTSAPETPSLQVSGIRFINQVASNTTAALNIDSRISRIDLQNLEMVNSSSPLLRGIAPEYASISNLVLTDNNISRAIDLFSTPTPFQIMTELTVEGVIAQNNVLVFSSNQSSSSSNSSSYEETSWETSSLIFLSVQSIDLITFSDSYFSNNPNILSIGYSPTSLVSDGVFLLKVERCEFRDHQPQPHAQVDGEPIASSINRESSALFFQSTTSFGPSWIFDRNTFSSNNVTIIKVDSIPAISFTRNHIEWHNQQMTFSGQISSYASFASNTYLHGSGMLSITSDESLPPSAVTNVTMNDEWLDFGGENLLSIAESEGALLAEIANVHSFYGFDKVVLKNVTYMNIEPANITSPLVHPAVVYLERVASATVELCSFKNVSLTTSGMHHAGRITAGFTLSTTTTTTLTLKSNNYFGAYDPRDTTTADVVAQCRSGAAGTLNLVNSPTTATLNLSRIASTIPNLVIQSPLIIRETLFNLAEFGFTFVSVSRISIHDPIVVYGRMSLSISSRADFFWTPSRNGSLVMVPVSTFIPRLTVTNCVFAVDLGDGLSVPSGSLYTLVSPSRIAALPTPSVIEAWSGKTAKPGFTGALIKTSIGTDPNNPAEEVFAIAMRASPTCSIPCVVGVCDKREDCTCSSGWSGTACTCLNDGRPSGATCSNSTTSFEWVATTPQIIAPSVRFSIPDSLTYYVNSDMSIVGELVMASTSRLVVTGALSISGSLSMESEADSYPFSCDVYMPNMISCGSLATTSSFSASVTLDAGSIPVCQNSKRDSIGSQGQSYSRRRDSEDFFDDSYNVLIAVNGSTQMAGSIHVDATSLDVTPGRQQQLGLVGSRGVLTQTDTLAVSATTKDGLCTTPDTKPTLISLTVTACNGEKTKTQWWWYGVPVIAIVVIFVLIVIIVVSVPSYRVAIFPYSAKMN